MLVGSSLEQHLNDLDAPHRHRRQQRRQRALRLHIRLGPERQQLLDCLAVPVLRGDDKSCCSALEKPTDVMVSMSALRGSSVPRHSTRPDALIFNFRS